MEKHVWLLEEAYGTEKCEKTLEQAWKDAKIKILKKAIQVLQELDAPKSLIEIDRKALEFYQTSSLKPAVKKGVSLLNTPIVEYTIKQVCVGKTVKDIMIATGIDGKQYKMSDGITINKVK